MPCVVLTVKKHSHCILSYFDHVQNYLKIDENLKKKKFTKIEKHWKDYNKSLGIKDAYGWRRLTRITNDEPKQFRLNFSRSPSLEVTSLS